MKGSPPPVSAAAVLRHAPRERGYTVVRDGAATVVGIDPAEVRTGRGDDAFAILRDAGRDGFWTGFVAYDLGRSVERVRPSEVIDDLGLPDVALARYDVRVVLPDHGEPELFGDGPARAALDRALVRAVREPFASDAPSVGPWASSLDGDAYADAFAHILDLVRAGECYQVNLTRRLRATGAPDPVALHAALAAVNPAPHAALCTFGAALPDLAIVSASPELYLRVDGRAVETRPIKGTGTDAALLAASVKDHAENVMIVDLARNDLGRVCEYGSVQVPALFEVEAHPGLYHLVSTVRGVLRPDVDLGDLVRATFPPASVTGAPKPRVLQAIEDLEPVRRGVYCGAVGWIDGDRARAELAVAIRTFTIANRHTYLGVGGGIVADSRLESEWAETELKAARLLAAAGALGTEPVSGPNPTVWLDGELVPLDAARVSVLDHGLVVGDGVFETLRVYRGQPFAWRRHLARLATSASGLGLPAPDESQLRAAADAVLAANGLQEARLRVTVTGGPAPPGSRRDPTVPPTAFVVAFPIEPPAPRADVVVVPWTRNEHGATAGLKTISYAANVRALAFAEARGASEAIFANTQGMLCEATGSNVFVVHRGALATPPASAGCLLGVTRGLLLELAGAAGVPAFERDIDLDELRNADEAFLSSTTREVQPIAHVDGAALPAAPGPVSATLAEAFKTLVAQNPDP